MVERIRNLSRIRLTAWFVWIVVAIVISIMCGAGYDRSVTPAYRFGTENWFAGKPIYDMKGYGFVYLPQAALLYAPWVCLPRTLGEIVWHCTNIGVLAFGVTSLTRLVSKDDRWVLINSVVSAGIGLGSIANGQATVIMAGLMMVGCANLSKKRWNQAAIMLTLAFACKPTSMILMLLATAIFPPMIWRMAIALTCFAAAPFLTQPADYVISQFVAFVQNSRIAYADGETGNWAHLFGLLRVTGLDAPSSFQQICRLAAGLTTLFWCWILVRKLSPERGGFYLYAISTCYLMLFSPRVEGCTYVLIGSVYGCLLADAWLCQHRHVAAIGLSIAIGLTVFSFDVALLVTHQPNEVWLNPFICLVVTGYIGFEVARELKTFKPFEGISTRVSMTTAV